MNTRRPDPETDFLLADLLSSGHTMKLALAALHAAGIPAWGFAYNGN